MFGLKFERGMTDARQEGVVGRCVSWSPSLRAGRTLEESGAGGFQTHGRGRCHQGRCHLMPLSWLTPITGVCGISMVDISTQFIGVMFTNFQLEAGKHLPCRCPRWVDRAGHDWAINESTWAVFRHPLALPTPGGGFFIGWASWSTGRSLGNPDGNAIFGAYNQVVSCLASWSGNWLVCSFDAHVVFSFGNLQPACLCRYQHDVCACDWVWSQTCMKGTGQQDSLFIDKD